MKIKKVTLDKNSTNVELANAIREACLKGYLDAAKGLDPKTDAGIVKHVLDGCMARHKAAVIQAYKAGFAQGKQHA